MVTGMLELLRTSGYMPRGACGQSEFWLLFVNLSDMLIAMAYVAIPLSIMYMWRWRLRFKFEFPVSILVMYALFIAACGLTHIADVLMTWWPAYWFNAVMHALTAIASWNCVIFTWFETRKRKT